MSSTALSSPQLRALLDILVHYETYTEVQSFKDPRAIDNYGYPFDGNSQSGPARDSASPLLQLLLTRIVLPIPGVRDLPPEFWSVKFRRIMKRFGEAELSESYDKGTLGSRKRLASAASVIHESVTRGLLSGVFGGPLPNLQEKYDLNRAEDLTRAWDDVVRQVVYGDLIDEIFDSLTESTNVEEHSPAVKAAIHHAIVYIATFLHHVFVLSPEGPYLLKLLDNVHKLIPYSMIGQTLRVSNAGTMITGLVRLFLAKVSVGAVSNWIGLTQNAADGMNLLQRIISLVLEWDAGEFRKATDSIKASEDRPSDAHLTTIHEHLQSSRGQRELIRKKSEEEEKSIVIAIFEWKNKDLIDNLTDTQHSQCLEYYSAKLAIRDREMITEVLCRQSPDLTTSIIRDGVSVFEPMIRAIHKNVDLRKHIGSIERFLGELIDTSKPKKRESAQKKDEVCPPSIEDYVGLLKRNRQAAYEYLHDFAVGCPDLRETWRDWAKSAIKVFRQDSENGIKIGDEKDRSDNLSSNPTSLPSDTGAMDAILQHLFIDLPNDKQSRVKAAIDSHVEYTSSLEEISTKRIQRIIEAPDDKGRSDWNSGGPGVYIARWHSLLDETTISPSTPKGKPRRGRDVKGSKALGKTDVVANPESLDPGFATRQEGQTWPNPPDVSVVIDALGPQFKDIVSNLSRRDLPRK
ncbi:PX-associated-domain-containing protein [Xylariaceae sp. FL0662B]|nr:PX-associated-domain-containing protein [Xylariaceae sp. FL0662B]